MMAVIVLGILQIYFYKNQIRTRSVKTENRNPCLKGIESVFLEYS